MLTMTDTNQIDAARDAVTRAVAKFNADKAALYAHDGKTPINAPAMHEKEVSRLLAPVTAAVERATATADKTLAEVEALRLQPHADPTTALSASDLEDAGRRWRWVAEDCAELSLAALAERVRAVQSTGNKPLTWLYSRYVQKRWKQELAKSPQAPDLTQFGDVLKDVGIVGPKQGLSAEAAKRADEAAKLRRWAGAQLNQAATGKNGTGVPMGL